MHQIFVLALLISPFLLSAQHKQEVLYPGVIGQDLLDELVTNYKPFQVQTYGDARDIMYGTIDIENDSVRCIYSDHAIFLPLGVDPSDYLLQNGSADGINTEHAYPQSKGASFGNARSDMHHLFPTRAEVNSRRNNFPFQEIDDDDTDTWFYKTFKQEDKPTSNIDAYSEWINGGFEPPEAKKGNIARAIFYFYTMYRTEALSRDATFFSTMRETLCDWHYQDPVDSLEWIRTKLISIYQSNKSNPFVLDCSLPERSYCQDAGQVCVITTATSLVKPELLSAVIAPNPVQQDLQLSLKLDQPARLRIQVINSMGQIVDLHTTDASAGSTQLHWSATAYTTGQYYLRLQVDYPNGADVETVIPFVK